MAYQIRWDKRAYRELKKIDNKDAVKILNTVSSLYDGPDKKGKPLVGKFKGKFRLRVKDYRIIYWIEESKGIVWIISVGHRRDIYK